MIPKIQMHCFNCALVSSQASQYLTLHMHGEILELALSNYTCKTLFLFFQEGFNFKSECHTSSTYVYVWQIHIHIFTPVWVFTFLWVLTWHWEGWLVVEAEALGSRAGCSPYYKEERIFYFFFFNREMWARGRMGDFPLPMEGYKEWSRSPWKQCHVSIRWCSCWLRCHWMLYH